MLKILLKKQILKMRSQKLQYSKIRILLIYFLLFVLLLSISSNFYTHLVLINLDWLYFDVMMLIAFIVGTGIGIIKTFSILYDINDSQILKPLPVPNKHILGARLIEILFFHLTTTCYFILFPALITYWTNKPPSVIKVILGLVLPVLLSSFELVLSSAFSFIVYNLISKIKNKRNKKNIERLILSMVLLFSSFVLLLSATYLTTPLFNNAKYWEIAIKKNVYPLYLIGCVGEGDLLSFVIVASVVIILLIATFFILLHNFSKITTSETIIKKKAYKEKEVRCKTIPFALLLNDIKRFISNPVYILTCCYGTFFYICVSIIAIFKEDWFYNCFEKTYNQSEGFIFFVTCAVVCFFSLFNFMSVVTISSEIKYILMIRSLPISMWQVIKSKIKLHLLFTEIPACICSTCMLKAFNVNIIFVLLAPIFSFIFILFMSSLELIIALKSPTLSFENESNSLQQSSYVIRKLRRILTILIIILFYLFQILSFSPVLYLITCAALFSLLILVQIHWLKNKGVKILETL